MMSCVCLFGQFLGPFSTDQDEIRLSVEAVQVEHPDTTFELSCTS